MDSARAHRNIFLIGFMASGKSAVGRELARRLGQDFIDLDSMIEAAASTSIPDLFAQRGEDGFRVLEAEALSRVIAGPGAVVATGGGAPCFGDQLQSMREAGLVIALDASMEVLLARAEQDEHTRPLLAASPGELAELYAVRAPIYRRAHATVATEGRTVEQTAAHVESIVSATSAIPAASLSRAAVVAPAGSLYNVVVERGALDRVGGFARTCLPDTCRTIGVVTDENVAPLYLARVTSSLEASGFSVCSATVPAGERAKELSVFGGVIDDLVAAGLDRGSCVVALGGGVVGDLAGFVAASLFRGVRVIQVPTTLLAMTDSAIGGKTGLNVAAGKNLVGAFWQPSLVLADPCSLETLPLRERRAAFGELIKYGLLDGDELYDRIDVLAAELGGADSLERISDDVLDMVQRCAGYKAWIVTRDERESGERALLNLGHTVGHAIEVAAGYGVLLHGEAVALGLVAACRVSHRLGLCGASVEQRVVDTLHRAGLDADLTPWLRPDVIERIGVDKKRTGSHVRFVTLQGVGTPAITSIELSQLSKILRG